MKTSPHNHHLQVPSIVLSVIFIVAAAPVGFLKSGDSLVADEPPQQADVIIVLGYPCDPDGSPSTVERMRVQKGVALYQDGFAPYVLFTGSAVNSRYVEAEVMAQYAATLGLPAQAIVLETRATTTLENACFTRQILENRSWHSALMVTSPYHTGRAERTFAAIGLDVIPIAAVAPEALPLTVRFRDLADEHMAQLDIMRHPEAWATCPDTEDGL